VKNPLRDRGDIRIAGAATGLGCSVVISLLIGILGGLFIDRWLGTEPIFTLIGVVLGLATAGYLLYELATLGRTDRRTPPEGPGAARRPPEVPEVDEE